MTHKQIVLTILAFFILLMISFSFPDLFALMYVPKQIVNGNIYSFVENNKIICPWLSAPYPPLYYITMGLYLNLITKINLIPPSLFTVNSCPVFDLILDKRFLFWSKLPYLILHFASAYIFSLFFSKNKFRSFLFWLLNPIAIFICFIEGQFEIFSACCMLLSFYFAKKEKLYLSSMLLGIGGAYKHFPFLLVIPFSTVLGKTFLKRIIFIFLSFIPYMISFLFFLNNDFLSTLAFSENHKMFELGITVAGIKISVFFFLYVLLLLILLREKKKDFNSLIKYSFLFGSLYFLTTHWSPQRFLFLLPSLLLLSTLRKQIFNLLPYLSALFFTYTLILYPDLFDHTLLRPIIHNISPINLGQAFIIPFAQNATYLTITGVLLVIVYFTAFNKTEKVDITRKDILLHFIPLFSYLGVIFVFTYISMVNF